MHQRVRGLFAAAKRKKLGLRAMERVTGISRMTLLRWRDGSVPTLAKLEAAEAKVKEYRR